jgi:hypothetical protein
VISNKNQFYILVILAAVSKIRMSGQYQLEEEECWKCHFDTFILC